MAKKRGRKPKLTPAVLKRLEPFVEDGFTDQTLARIAKVSKRTFSQWKKKSETAKTGIYYKFRLLYEDLQAGEQKVVMKSLIGGVKNQNIKAVELAMKRHPRMKSVFKEEPAESQLSGTVNFILPKGISDLFEDPGIEEAREGEKEREDDDLEAYTKSDDDNKS